MVVGFGGLLGYGGDAVATSHATASGGWRPVQLAVGVGDTTLIAS